MPEGPEVRIIADTLLIEITGLSLISIEYNSSSRYNKKKIEGLEELSNLLPLTIADIDTKGKKILFQLTSEDGYQAFLVSSLMMEGKWTWDKGKHSDLWLNLQDIDGNDYILYFDDSRHFGTFEIFLSLDDLKERLSDIGPDLLSDDIDITTWQNTLANKRLKNKKIGLFLMDQKYFSGIGNYLRAEILYDCKISPHRKLCELSAEDVDNLFESSTRIIRNSYQAQGLTIATFWDPHGRKGNFTVKVYNKTCDPDGCNVITEKLGDRTVHWVPDVQV